MSLAHDYRWLGSSIKTALRDDHMDRRQASRGGGQAERSWKAIERENEIHAERTKKAMDEVAAQGRTPGVMTTATPANGAPTSTVITNKDPAAALQRSEDPNMLQVAENDPIYRLSHLVDPSSFFPADRERPFTGVKLVALAKQRDWSVIKRRAAKIAELRKQQLSHAYQTDAQAGQSTAQQKAFNRRQNKLDRKRMKLINKQEKEKQRAKMQKESSMALSPPHTSSSDDSSSSDEDPALRHGVLAGYKRGVKLVPDHDSDDDGPPPDAEEIQMRMERAAWKRTRDIIGRTLNTLAGGKHQPPTPSAGGSTSLNGLPNRKSAPRGSIMISNDRRVQGVYKSADEALAIKEAELAKIRSDEEKKEQAKMMARAKRADDVRRQQEQRAEHRNLMKPAILQRRLDISSPVGDQRLLDRSELPGEEEKSTASPLLRSPSRAQSLVSVNGKQGVSSRTMSQSSSIAELPGLSHSESAPVLTVGGHTIRAPSPKKKRESSTASSSPITSAPATPQLDSLSPKYGSTASYAVTPLSTVSEGGAQPQSGSLLLNRRRARSVMPLPSGSASSLLPSTTVNLDAADDDEEPSDTFSLTQLPASLSHSASAPVFTVSEHAPSAPLSPSAPAAFFPSRPERAGLASHVTNVLSPVRKSVEMQSEIIEGALVHSLKTGAIEEHKPTLLQPITSIVRSFTGNPLDQVNTQLIARPGNETMQVMRQLQSNLAATDQEIHHLLTPEQQLRRRVVEAALIADDPFSFLRATAGHNKDTPRMQYSKQRTEKSELASKIMMSFSHADMDNISAEIVRNGGEMTCADFIRTTRRKVKGDRDYEAETEALQDMFREIDVNGDLHLSFLEFTSYLVELAHTQYAGGASDDHLTSTNYQALEDQALVANEDEIDYSHIKYFEQIESFIAFEKDQVRFKVYNKQLRLTKIIRGHTQPILACEFLPFHQLLVTSSLDKTLKFWSCNYDKDGREREREKQEKIEREEKERLGLAGASSKEARRKELEAIRWGGKMTEKFQGSASGNQDALWGGSVAAMERAKKRASAIGEVSVGLSAFRSGGIGDVSNTNLLGSQYSRSKRKSPPAPTFAEIASWLTPLPQFGLCWNKTRLYSSDSTGRIIVWNVDSGDTRTSLMGHDAQVNAMIPVPEMLASAGDDATVRLWDNGHGTEVACLRRHQRSIRALCYSSATNLLASGGDDDYLRLWDINTHKQVSSFSFEQSWFKTLPGMESDSVVSMEAMDHELAVGSRRGTFRLFDLRMNVPLQTFHLPDVDEESMAHAALDAAEEANKPKRKKLLSSSSTVVDEDPETDLERLRRRAKIQLRSFCIYRDEALIEQHAQKTKEAQRERDEERAKQLEHCAAMGLPLDTAPEVVVELPRDPRCQLIIAAAGRHIHRFGKGGSITRHISHDDPILYSEFNANSLTIFTCSARQVKIWCCITGRLISEFNDLVMKENVGNGLVLITAACLDQRKRKFILGDNIGNIYIFNYKTGALMHKLSNTAPGHGSRIVPNATAGTEVQNLHCLLNVSYTAGVTSPSVSINFIHSLANSLHIHVDDPDHAVGKEGATVEQKKDQAGRKGLTDKGGQARTVLHSIAAHKGDIACVAISEKFGMIVSGAADASLVCYPWELAGSATQRIIPAEALFHIASPFAQQQDVELDVSIDHFKTPILSVIFLLPYKMLCCSDSLGHIFFYYFTRETHVLIGLIRNTKKLESLAQLPPIQSPQASPGASPAPPNKHRRGRTVAPRDILPTDHHTPEQREREKLIDYPPVLSMVFDAKSSMLYTADDMGAIKGWNLQSCLFEPHIESHRARRWNPFNSLAPSAQRPPRAFHGFGGFKQDDHPLMTQDEISTVFHPKTPSTVAAGSQQFYDDLQAASYMFRIRPTVMIQAHSGACTGVQLVPADAGLKERLEEAAAAEDALAKEQGPLSPTFSISSHDKSHSPLIFPSPAPSEKYPKRASLVNPINFGHRASLSSGQATPMQWGSDDGGDGNTSDKEGGKLSRRSSQAVTPRTFVADHEADRLGHSAGRVPSAVAASPSTEEKTDAGPSLSQKDLVALQEAKLQRWEEAQWDDDTSSDGDDETLSKGLLSSLPSSSSASKIHTYRDVRDLPDHPRGQGRRVSVAMELKVRREEKEKGEQRARSRERRGSVPVTQLTIQTDAPAAPIIAAKPNRINTKTPSGECLLSFGSDGCVHLFSVTSQKRLATLQQGFTIRNCKKTPNDWNFSYPIRERKEKDEALLQEMIAEVEASEQAIYQAAIDAANKREEAIRRKLIRDAFEGDGDRDKQFDPFRNVKRKTLPSRKVKRLTTGGSSSTSSKRQSTEGLHGMQKLLMPPSDGGEEKTISAASTVGDDADAITAALHNALNESQSHIEEHEESEAGHEEDSVSEVATDDQISSALSRSGRKLSREFIELEEDIRKVVKKKMKQSNSEKGKRLTDGGHVSSSALSPEQAKEIATAKAMIVSKSMSALTKTLYDVAPVLQKPTTQQQLQMSSSLSTSALQYLPGNHAQAPRPDAPASKKFAEVDYESTWTDYDGTQRTFEDPLAYRFSLDSYLADVATRHDIDSSDTIAPALAALHSPQSGRGLNVRSSRNVDVSPQTGRNQPDTAYSDSTDGPNSAHPYVGRDSPVRQMRGSAMVHRGTLSTRSPNDALGHDPNMAAMQQQALDRQRQIQVADARAERKAKARSLSVLHATLERERSIQEQLRHENKKLSPRSASTVRMRMLISRKPHSVLESQLAAVGMRVNEDIPRVKKHRNAFGEIVEEKYTRSELRGTSTLLKVSHGHSFEQALKKVQDKQAAEAQLSMPQAQ